MIQLETIKISNAKKLGKNVKIDFGQGATIIVAPNGTGKTTIFEAIELVITNDIKRLRNKLGAVVNRDASSMSVQLEFNDKQIIKTDIDKYGNRIIEGHDIRKVLGVSKDISLPYLFRLTHFFEQNSKNWFVGCDESEAGRLLGSLPIGRDLQEVLAKKTSLLKAFTTMESRIIMELETIEKDIRYFEGLLKDKKNLPASISGIELKDIVKKMKKIAINYEVQINETEDQINVLHGTWELVKNRIVQQKEINLSTINRLLAFESRIVFYQERQVDITQKKDIIFSMKNELEKLQNELQKYYDQRNDFQFKLNEATEAEVKTKQIISNFKMIEIIEGKMKNKKGDLEKCKDIITNTTIELNRQNEVIERYRHLLNQQENLQEEIKFVQEKLIDLREKERNLESWKEKISKISELNANKLQVESDINKERSVRQGAEQNVQVSIQNHQKIKENLDLLRKSEEENLAALSVIRKKIKPDTKICPICQAKYEYGELDKRISKALKNLNPVLEKAVADEEEASAIVIQMEEFLGQEEIRLNALNVLYENIQKELKELTISVDQIKKAVFIEEEAIDEEQTKVKNEIDEKNSRLLELQEKQNQLPVLNVEEYQNAKESKGIMERKLEEVRKQRVSIEMEIESANHEMGLLNKDLSEDDKEEQIKQLELYVRESEKYRKLLSECETNLNTFHNKINNLKRDIASGEDEVSIMNVTQERTLHEWKEFNIGQTLDKEIVENEIAKRKEKDVQYETDLKSLHVLQDKLFLLKGYYDGKNIEEKLREQAGDKNIEQYHEMLLDQRQRKMDEKENMLEKRKAVNKFFEEIMTKSKNAQIQLQVINDVWKRILKQMAVTSLLTSAPLLDNKISYNKPKARTKALIHNEDIDIVNVASEGQITDLQLSFMLAMNCKYSWTPWKALLLDDPMQHHDLVHTSAVLDVLRDYIADFGFQILLSTHDFLQADYFSRKFKNDGIKCKIYQLVQREGGVAAEKIR